jgi:hypothetical protein
MKFVKKNARLPSTKNLMFACPHTKLQVWERKIMVYCTNAEPKMWKVPQFALTAVLLFTVQVILLALMLGV